MASENRRLDPRVGCVRHGQGDVLAYGAVHELDVLEHKPHAGVKLVGGERADVTAVDADRATVDVMEWASSAASVDLPEPDGPTSAVAVPGRSLSDTSQTTGPVPEGDTVEHDRPRRAVPVLGGGAVEGAEFLLEGAGPGRP